MLLFERNTNSYLFRSFHLDSRQNAIEDKVVIGFDHDGDHDSDRETSEKEKHNSD